MAVAVARHAGARYVVVTDVNPYRLELAREPVVWWSLIAAFVFMFILVLAANLFADAVRDAFDPRIRERGV